jgi:hypothetical protein
MSPQRWMVVLMVTVVGVVAGTITATLPTRPPAVDPRFGEIPASVAERIAPPVQLDASLATLNVSAAPVAAAAEAGGVTLRRVPLDGQDLADLMQLLVWKFEARMPEDQYTLAVWTEKWTRGDTQPIVTELSKTSSRWSGGRLLVHLPTEKSRDAFVQWATDADHVAARAMSRRPDSEPIHRLVPNPAVTDLPSTPTRAGFGQDIILATFSSNRDGSFPQVADAERHLHSDVTLYLKARFTTSGK